MRCGCSQDAVVVDDGHGIDTTETRDGNVVHYQPNVDGSVLTGNGMTWNQQTRRFQVKLAGAGSGLSFDGTGGLYVSDKEGGGGFTPGASVRELAERAPAQNIVGGFLGAGYFIKPQSTRRSYTYGVQRGMDLMHVPVRPLRDGSPVVTPDEFLGPQNGDIQDGGQPTPVLRQDVHRWGAVPDKCGAWPWRVDDEDNINQPVDRPYRGWFGYLEAAEDALLTLPDVFDLVGRSSVLWLELAFPPIAQDEGGNPVWQYPDRSPTDDQVASLIDRTRVLIQRYGLVQSVIVSTATPQVPSSSGTPVDVLTGFYQSSITTGPMFTSAEQLTAYPPESWPQAWSWAGVNTSIPPETVKPYADAGVHCLYWACNRQHQLADLVQPSGSGGVLSGDPEYFAGQIDSHPTAGKYLYRKTSSDWYFNTVNHGTLPASEKLDAVHAGRRAYHEVGGNWMQLGKTARVPGGVYYVLQGWASPIATPDDYLLALQTDIHGPTNAATGLGSEWVLGVDTDAPYAGLPQAKQGYVISYRVADNGNIKRVRIKTWDPQANEGAGAEVELYNRVGDWFGSDYCPLRVRINKDRLEFAGMPPADPVNGKPVWVYDTSQDTVNPRAKELGTLYRGGYMFAGREDPGGDENAEEFNAACRWQGVGIRANSGG